MVVHSPEVDSRIHFYAATAFVKKHIPKGWVSKGSHDHGKQKVALDDGYIIIEQKWNPGPKEPVKEIPELTKKRLSRTKGRKRSSVRKR